MTQNSTQYAIGARKVLDDEALRKAAPSIFAEHAHTSRSGRYSFIPTIQVVNTLRNQGWLPVNAREQKVVGADPEQRQGYQKHIVKFHHPNHQLTQYQPGVHEFIENGDVVPELNLTNSHNGGSAYELSAGLFRLVCRNGLMVCEAVLAHVHIRHVGYTDGDVRRAGDYFSDNIGKSLERVAAFRAVTLNEQEQLSLAVGAAMAKWRVNQPGQLPFDPRRLLQARRQEDMSGDLWTTFNRVQENLLKGGVRYEKMVRDENTGRELYKRQRTRAITGINEDLRLNSKLWDIAESLWREKTGK
jgi:hypothetical protein